MVAAKGNLSQSGGIDASRQSASCWRLIESMAGHILETLRFLIDVIERIEEHHCKKTVRLRQLHVASRRNAPASDGPNAFDQHSQATDPIDRRLDLQGPLRSITHSARLPIAASLTARDGIPPWPAIRSPALPR